MDETTLKVFYRRQLVIWAGFMVTPVVYLLVGKLYLAGELSFENAPDVERLRYLFAAASISVLMANTWFMKRVLGSDKYTGEGTAALGPYETVNMFLSSMSALPAIFGIVLFVLAGDEFDLYAFCALSLVYLFMFMPKFAALKGWAQYRGFIENKGGKVAGSGGVEE